MSTQAGNLDETFTVPGGTRAGRVVREIVRPRVREHLGERGAYDVELMIGELVSNAVRHGGADETATLEIELRIDGSEVRFAVSDPGPGFVRPPAPSARHSGGGNGFVIVERLADDWGVERGGRTRVWFAYVDGG